MAENKTIKKLHWKAILEHFLEHGNCFRSVLQTGWLTYKDSGVDISAGDSIVYEIKPAVETTTRKEVMGTLGGFGALFDIKASSYTDPILVSGTDGVGTKLKVSSCCILFDTGLWFWFDRQLWLIHNG